MNMEGFEPMDCGGVSLERIKELTMKKIKAENKPTRRPLKIVMLAAALIAALGITAFAAADIWGFTDTSGMSRHEINRLLKEHTTVEFTEMVAPDGSVSYMDGSEVLFTLSAEDAAEYEEARRESKQQAVRKSTDMLDVDSMELFPNSVTEIAVDKSGAFGDFIIGNGHTVVLCAQDGGNFSLEQGTKVALTVRSGERCVARWGLVCDGEMLEEVSVKGEMIEHCFDIPSDGEYCFTLSYYSADADNFTDGKITIE